MLESLAHRGPDGAGKWIEGPVGLGHRMLHTTPESLHEKLPLAKRELVITADARIDNREELIKALGLTERTPEGLSDSELILGAYERWGERCPERLLGDFAFAVWDGRRRVLFCARDHMGVKPFYYYDRPGKLFAFGSEIKALLCIEGVPQRLNEVRVADYLMPILEDTANTFYRSIWRLPPAHVMSVGHEGVKLRRYWALDISKETRRRSDMEYAEAFREIFTEAVRCRLRSAFPVGSQLSGGVDSSAVACVARDLLAEEGENKRLHSFSAVFPSVPQSDESDFIDAVLTRGGIEAHKVRADFLSPLVDIERVHWHQDEAFYSPNLYLDWGLYGAAQQHNVRIVLDGFDGDSTVSHGLGYLPELARRGRWWALAAEVRGFCVHYDCSSRQLFMDRVVRALAPEPLRHVWRALRGREQVSVLDNKVIDRDFARHVGLTERYQALEGHRQRLPRTSRIDHWLEISSGVHPFTLEVGNKQASAFCVEPRSPFFDKRLVEFCLALPGEQKLNKGWGRVIMRRALAESMPKEVCWRGTKADLSFAFDRNLLKFDRKLLDDVMLGDPQVLKPYVDVVALREEYDRYVARQPDVDGMNVWKAATLALWLQRSGLSP